MTNSVVNCRWQSNKFNMKLNGVVFIIFATFIGLSAAGLFFSPKTNKRHMYIEIALPETTTLPMTTLQNDDELAFTLPPLDLGEKSDKFASNFFKEVDDRIANLTFEINVTTTDEEELDDILDKILQDTAAEQGVELNDTFLRKIKEQIIRTIINVTGRIMIKVFMP